MSTAVEPPRADAAPSDEPPRRRRSRQSPRRVVIVGGGVVLAAAVAIVAREAFSGSDGSSTGIGRNGVPTSLATVKQGPLTSEVNASGTLGYKAQVDGSPYRVLNQASGAFTELPVPGQVTRCGQVLYRVANSPVLLLCGNTPAYRSLSDGDSGPDVKELNANLVRLGYATSSELDPSSDYFSGETADALIRLQAKFGIDQTGSLALGQAEILPGPLRIGTVSATLGAPAAPGMPVAEATSTGRQVQVELDAAQQSSVKVGDKALITLPSNRTTPGVVSQIGAVASSAGSGGGASSSSSSSSATIPVYITLDHPAAAAQLDQAPVQVLITTAGIRSAVIVPVDALLAQSGGGYAVETVAARGVRHLVPVTLGLFDDADGLVQITNGTLTAGTEVAVPAI
jgi:peptidoglycan hydrolase-like protein with peptidoglycan-binding domain